MKNKQYNTHIQVVLNRSSTEQQTIGRFDPLETGNECTPVVFETLALINHQIRKFSDLIETLFITNGNLITGNNNGEIVLLFVFGVQRALNHGISFGLGAMETNYGVGGKPLFEFPDPVG